MNRLFAIVVALLIAAPVYAQDGQVDPSTPTTPAATAVHNDSAVSPASSGDDDSADDDDSASAPLSVAPQAHPGVAESPETESVPQPKPEVVETGGDAAFASFDAAFGKYVVGPMAAVLFWDVMFWDNDQKDGNAFPLVVLWLVLGAVFFTLRMSFINLRGFGHAIEVTRGAYDNPDDPGEISHFQALSSALSATVGLGNIAGVAIAVGVGGPGAVLWMVLAGFLGMSSKFVECTLGQMYRTVDAEGHVMGGPMRYLEVGLSELGSAKLGKALAVLFALMCIGGSLGGGNMFQANQSFAAVSEVIPLFEGRGWLYGLLLAVAVGAVILGGIKRIGMAAGVIVPVMCGIYVLAAIWILIANASEVPAAVSIIVGEAFKPIAVGGGVIGVIVQGFKRAAFSNEAGIGSASIAHSAAATDEPVREGIVALLEPFIDTIIVCTMTGLVVVITGAYKMDTGDGVLMTSAAFESVLPWFPIVLSFAVVSFAFSTMISWSYYGERCVTYLFGPAASVPYKVVFLLCVFLGSVFKLGNVLDFSDLMVLGMAFPNILGAFMLSGKVRTALDDYWGRLQSGAMPRVK